MKRCVPGLRAACPPDMERLGAGCIEPAVNGGDFVGEEWGDAVAACHARGRSLCTLSEIITCDSLNLSKSRDKSCGDQTDPDAGPPIWTSTTKAESGQNAFSRPVRFDGDDNGVDEQATDTGGIYDYFCCAPLGTP